MAAVEFVMDNSAPNNNPGTGGSSRRPKKAIIESDPEEEESSEKLELFLGGVHSAPPSSLNYSMDISQLEAPTFTTLDRGPSQSMIMLKWDHEVNLIGKKVVNPMIHCCDKCLKPILIYGRMIPCKHVFCLKCARSEKSGCSRCGEKFSRVEQAGLGSIYMCSHGGSRYGNNGCRRTYLSQRDLHAHIQHRHVKSASNVSSSSTAATTVATAAVVASVNNSAIAPPPRVPPATSATSCSSPLLLHKAPSTEVYRPKTAGEEMMYNNRSYSPRTFTYTAPPQQPPAQSQPPTQPISVISSNRTASNLITVPIEGDQNGDYGAYSGSYNGQYGGVGAYPGTYSHPPPNYPNPQVSVGSDPNYYPNYDTAYNNGSYRTPNAGGGGPPSSYYRR